MTTDTRKMLGAYRALSLLDLEAMSDDALRAELVADGIDPDTLAESIADTLDEVVAACLREQVARSLSVGQASIARRSLHRRPTIERIKELIRDAMKRDPQLATAFREGTHQTSSDLESLYDDLVLMGKIPPDDESV